MDKKNLLVIGIIVLLTAVLLLGCARAEFAPLLDAFEQDYENGRVVDPAQNLDQIADVLIVDGKIAALGVPGVATRSTSLPSTSNTKVGVAETAKRSKSSAPPLARARNSSILSQGTRLRISS